ncbi:glycosyltransferase [Aquimarina sp. U1-2]|uniref:glycosyltransferase family 2 protein n=1 Tax=Aquimarina sp. U1-2 TaxID=2823141 RepID=UPI001AECABCE|nr:glycosyltransferase family 2 protein [Aquimarina sp. U1-2]MBP2832922.1 glycosyltransferase [Aquimarina sp. U1-2]
MFILSIEKISPAFIDFIPILVSFFLILNSLTILIMGISRLFFIKAIDLKFPKIDCTNEPLISIHLPTCNEPPELVIKTIKSILAGRYENFELIVLSNNTTNKNVWKPLKDFCVSQGRHVKFYHYSKVYGYKAGALNIALQLTSSKAEYIMVVDADYELIPDALNIAVKGIQSKKVDVLQFPQSYRNSGDKTRGLKTCYDHYFSYYLSSKKVDKMCLLTGTLSIMKASVFEVMGKWPTDTITEDAHFGVNILNEGMKISYSNVKIGNGLMPTTVDDYFKQYQRWVFGNFQTYILLFRKGKLPFKEKLKLGTLLTVWLNLLAYTFIVLLIVNPLLAILGVDITLISTLAISNILLHITIQLAILLKSCKYNVWSCIKGFLIHLSSVDIGSFYWLSYVFNRQKPFKRTNKFLKRSTFDVTIYLLPTYMSLIATILYYYEYTGLACMYIFFATLIMISKLTLITELKQSYNYILKPQLL